MRYLWVPRDKTINVSLPFTVIWGGKCIDLGAGFPVVRGLDGHPHLYGED